MPPRCKFTREEIACAAIDIVRENGAAAVTARAVGERLRSSSKVIFSLFRNMDELQGEILSEAEKIFRSAMEAEMSEGRYPPYKASGMAYIRFAAEERELFKLLFMRTRTKEESLSGFKGVDGIIELIRENMGLSREDAELFHLEMWTVTHGIAATIATSYAEWDVELISNLLTDVFEGLRYRFRERMMSDGSN